MIISSRIKYITGIIAFLSVASVWVVEQVLPYSGIKPARHKPEDFVRFLPHGVRPEDYGLHAKKISIPTADHLRLSALLVNADADTLKAIVVVLHGITACKETALPCAKMLADAGYASLLLDLRAHGESDGEYCTFGYYEKNDLHAVADTLASRCPGRPIGIWGESLGGAIALQAMALDTRYRFGVVASTFDEFEKTAIEYEADWLFGLRSRWLARHVLQKSGAIAHFDPFAVKPVVAAAQIDRPVMFIHGDKDARIPMWFGQRNFEACPAPGKEWYKVQGAGHLNVWAAGGDSLRSHVLAFLQKNYKE